MTKLEVLNTHVLCDQDGSKWMSANSLQELAVDHSAVVRMHDDALFHCTALQLLCLRHCSIDCHTSEHALDIMDGVAGLPDDLSTLTQLIQLPLTVRSRIEGVLGSQADCTEGARPALAI